MTNDNRMETEQIVNASIKEKTPEQELQEIYREQQILDARTKEIRSRLTDIDKQIKWSESEYRKMRRSKRWVFFLCFFLAAVVVGVSVNRIKKLTHDEEDAWLRYYKNQYNAWETKTIDEYYDKVKEKRRLQADKLSENNRDEINAYIASLDRVVDGVRFDTVDFVTRFTDTDIYELQKYTMGGVSTTIFPGAVLKGDSLFQGTADYTLLPLERTPMRLASNQIGGNSEELVNVSNQGVMAFLDHCAAKNEGQAAKEWSYYMQAFRTSKELKASLGIEIPDMGGFSLDQTNRMETSSVAVIYKQLHYTVSAEPQKTAADYFQTGSDMAALGDYEPAYVSSVDYGRMIVVLVQGNMSTQELGAKVGACIEGVNISAGLTNICMNSEITSHIFQYGGEQRDAGLITDTSEKKMGVVDKWNEFWNGSEDRGTVENRINDFIQSDAPATNSVPMGYTLKYLTDNSFVPAMMVTGRESFSFPADHVIKKVTISTNYPVNWDNSDMVGMQIATSENEDSYRYEFLWDSNGADLLKGETDYGNDGAVELRISEYLPEGKDRVAIGYIKTDDDSVLGFSEPKPHDVYADVLISGY